MLLLRRAGGVLLPKPDVHEGLSDQGCRLVELAWQTAQQTGAFVACPNSGVASM